MIDLSIKGFQPKYNFTMEELKKELTVVTTEF